MKERQGVSELMLERYHLGEMNSVEKKQVETLLNVDSVFRDRLEWLEESDRELRLSCSLESFPKLKQAPRVRRFSPPADRTVMPFFWAVCAAAILVAVLFPALHFFRGQSPTDRAKGSSAALTELALYLRGDREEPLSEKAVLGEGSTVQLAYTIPAGSDYYGVIFSIDGRSAVTLHYPYREGQNSHLESGKRIFLDEAYTLDDAPDFEMFVMVISEFPLEAETVLRKARNLAAAKTTADIFPAQCRAAFDGSVVEILTVLKK
jgi:hypothetical protein